MTTESNIADEKLKQNVAWEEWFKGWLSSNLEELEAIDPNALTLR